MTGAPPSECAGHADSTLAYVRNATFIDRMPTIVNGSDARDPQYPATHGSPPSPSAVVPDGSGVGARHQPGRRAARSAAIHSQPEARRLEDPRVEPAVGRLGLHPAVGQLVPGGDAQCLEDALGVGSSSHSGIVRAAT